MKARDGRNASRIMVRIEVNGVNVYRTIRRRYDPVFLYSDFITTLNRNELLTAVQATFGQLFFQRPFLLVPRVFVFHLSHIYRRH